MFVTTSESTPSHNQTVLSAAWVDCPFQSPAKETGGHAISPICPFHGDPSPGRVNAPEGSASFGIRDPAKEAQDGARAGSRRPETSGAYVPVRERMRRSAEHRKLFVDTKAVFGPAGCPQMEGNA